MLGGESRFVNKIVKGIKMMSDETRIIRYLLGEVVREYQGKLKLEIALSVFGIEPKLSDNPKIILKVCTKW